MINLISTWFHALAFSDKPSTWYQNAFMWILYGILVVVMWVYNKFVGITK